MRPPVLALLALLATPAQAAEEVDVELLLLVDVSRSMSTAELELQRQGYVQALRSDSLAAALGRALTGRIALAYVEWAGEKRMHGKHKHALQCLTQHGSWAAEIEPYKFLITCHRKPYWRFPA